MSEKTIGQRIAEELDAPKDNGDGTVTTWAPVTVPKDWLETGRKIVRVGSAKQGDVFYSTSLEGFICAGVDHYMDEVRVILSDPPAPQFREGGYYRTRDGELVGPLCQFRDDMHRRKWSCPGWVGWFADGHVDDDGTDCAGDLLPGEVTVWQPPASLPAGGWTYGKQSCVLWGDSQAHGSSCMIGLPSVVFSDWTDPPKPGRYRVPGGGKIATWEGDA